VLVHYLGDRLAYREPAGIFNRYNLIVTRQCERDHAVVAENFLLNIPNFISRSYSITGFFFGSKIPGLRFGKCIYINPSLKKKAALLRNLRQRILEAIVDLAKHSRPELDRQEFPGKLNLLPDL